MLLEMEQLQDIIKDIIVTPQGASIVGVLGLALIGSIRILILHRRDVRYRRWERNKLLEDRSIKYFESNRDSVKFERFDRVESKDKKVK
jgi:hypothetical protein